MADQRSADRRPADAGPTLLPELDSGDAVDRVVESSGGRVGLAGVLTDLDRVARVAEVPGTSVACAYLWDESDDATKQWWPQGLSTSADADPEPAARFGGPVVLAAWYARSRWRSGEVAARVSVLDLRIEHAARYAHVLLVEPYRPFWSRRWRYRDIAVHAGGLVWVGDLLLVADTRAGLRVFDVRDVVAVRDRRRTTRGCRYVLPQRGWWRAVTTPGARPMRWSFVALDRTEAGSTWLIAGEYSRSGSGARLVRLPLEPLLAGDPAESVEVVTPGIRSMQGATRVDGRYWISASSGSRRRGHLWNGVAGEPFAGFEGALPVGPEDVSYDAEGRCLWTQTEHPGSRLVVCVPLSSVG